MKTFLKPVEFLNTLFLSCRKFMRGALNIDVTLNLKNFTPKWPRYRSGEFAPGDGTALAVIWIDLILKIGNKVIIGSV